MKGMIKNRIEDMMRDLFRVLEEYENGYGLSIPIGKYLEIKQRFIEAAHRTGLP